METNERPSVVQSLEASPLLRCLTPEQKRTLAETCRVVHADRGEVIWLCGSEVDYFGLVASGFVKMVRTTGDGSDVTLELMGPGQIFGMLGTIERTGCPLSAVAVTNTWYVRIPKYAFLPLYEDCAPLKDGLIRLSATRLHTQNDLRARLSKGRVEERIAAILFMLADSYGERKGNTLRLRVPLTRQDIAEMAGTTVETTIRTLSRWQKLGYLRTRSHFIAILDEAALNDFLRF